MMFWCRKVKTEDYSSSGRSATGAFPSAKEDANTESTRGSNGEQVPPKQIVIQNESDESILSNENNGNGLVGIAPPSWVPKRGCDDNSANSSGGSTHSTIVTANKRHDLLDISNRDDYMNLSAQEDDAVFVPLTILSDLEENREDSSITLPSIDQVLPPRPSRYTALKTIFSAESSEDTGSVYKDEEETLEELDIRRNGNEATCNDGMNEQDESHQKEEGGRCGPQKVAEEEENRIKLQTNHADRLRRESATEMERQKHNQRFELEERRKRRQEAEEERQKQRLVIMEERQKRQKQLEEYAEKRKEEQERERRRQQQFLEQQVHRRQQVAQQQERRQQLKLARLQQQHQHSSHQSDDSPSSRPSQHKSADQEEVSESERIEDKFGLPLPPFSLELFKRLRIQKDRLDEQLSQESERKRKEDLAPRHEEPVSVPLISPNDATAEGKRAFNICSADKAAYESLRLSSKVKWSLVQPNESLTVNLPGRRSRGRTVDEDDSVKPAPPSRVESQPVKAEVTPVVQAFEHGVGEAINEAPDENESESKHKAETPYFHPHPRSSIKMRSRKAPIMSLLGGMSKNTISQEVPKASSSSNRVEYYKKYVEAYKSHVSARVSSKPAGQNCTPIQKRQWRQDIAESRNHERRARAIFELEDSKRRIALSRGTSGR